MQKIVCPAEKLSQKDRYEYKTLTFSLLGFTVERVQESFEGTWKRLAKAS